MTWWQDQWSIILIALLATPAVATILFAWWLGRHPKVDLESGAKCWDVFVKLTSAMTVIVSGAMLFGKYVDHYYEAQKNATSSANRALRIKEAEFLKHQLDFDQEHLRRKQVLFEEAKTVVARLAKDEQKNSDTMRRFDELYLASLIGVEELRGPVELAMVDFEKKLRNKPDAPTDSLHMLSLKLSRACEQELKASRDQILQQYKRISDLVGGEAPSK